MFSIDEICQITQGTLIQGNPKTVIEHVHFDSRRMEKNGLFIALTSGQRDGHAFIHHALENGAAAALVSDPDLIPETVSPKAGLIQVADTERALQQLARAYRKKLDIPFIAVTGSNGKTTTKDMISHLLTVKYHTYKTYKNLNNHLGVPLSILQIRPEHQAAVLELGMNRYGEIDFLASIVQPDISIITNVNDAHIEYFGSKENIAKAKAELLPHTRPDGLVLLNGDQPHVRVLAEKSPAKVRFFGLNDPKADITAGEIQTTETGVSFDVRLRHPVLQDWHTVRFRMPLFGKHNVCNVLPAIYIAYHLKLSPVQIEWGLESLRISDMRFEKLANPFGSGLIINDAYNASPASMKQSVATFMEIQPETKKALVLGDMYELGAQEEDLHREVGRFLNDFKSSIESLITVGEKSRWIFEEFKGPRTHCSSLEEAESVVEERIKGGASVLFKASRGMKLETLLARVIGR